MRIKTIIFRTAALLVGAVSASVVSFGQGSSTKSLGLNTVVIDPGHGGKDPGCVSSDKKTYEKTLVLKISEGLQKKILAAYPDMSVYLTRSSNDVFVPLNDRAKYATNKGAGLFISIHINATKNKSVNGFSAWILGQSSKSNSDTYAFNMEICQRENEVIMLEDDYTTKYKGFDPSDPESDIFLHLMNNAYREQSLIFAQLVDQKMSEGGPFKNSLGVRQQNFAVLRLASMPAVLLEMGFMSNSSDLAQLRDSKSLEKMIDKIFDAFCEYKTYYDESVGATVKKPKPQKPQISDEKKAEEPVSKPSTEQVNTSSAVYYATQVLATGKKMSASDKYFLGYEPKSIWTGKLFKYFIGCSEDEAKAREMYKKIKVKYPESFLVKVENELCTRVK
ncbi:MAG: N-acetylmuramoyl-L-alanine amidase [Bacteroidales bacterium]|nr:N-acetylmuramoyl-L-alanine amidase [Bacteroidales bacterium]